MFDIKEWNTWVYDEVNIISIASKYSNGEKTAKYF